MKVISFCNMFMGRSNDCSPFISSQKHKGISSEKVKSV